MVIVAKKEKKDMREKKKLRYYPSAQRIFVKNKIFQNWLLYYSRSLPTTNEQLNLGKYANVHVMQSCTCNKRLSRLKKQVSLFQALDFQVKGRDYKTSVHIFRLLHSAKSNYSVNFGC